MVALARNPASEKTRLRGKNHVGDFFGDYDAASGKPLPKSLNRIGKKSSDTTTRVGTNFWGKDLSGSLHGAGGVGGLLMVTEAGTDYIVSYDGNGNVVGLTNATTGELAAAYEYSPYGKLIRSEGPMADRNPFRFSAKYTDDETGLVYYGLRYYDPHLGRFLNRDPIAEKGGLNLYAAFGNDPINNIDVLGMSSWSPITQSEQDDMARHYDKLYKGFTPIEAKNGVFKVFDDGNIVYEHRSGDLAFIDTEGTFQANILRQDGSYLGVDLNSASLGVSDPFAGDFGFADQYDRSPAPIYSHDGFGAGSGPGSINPDAPVSTASGSGIVGPMPSNSGRSSAQRSLRLDPEVARMVTANLTDSGLRGAAEDSPGLTPQQFRAAVQEGRDRRSARDLALIGEAVVSVVPLGHALKAGRGIHKGYKVTRNLARASNRLPGDWQAYQKAAGGLGQASRPEVSSTGWKIYKAAGGRQTALGFQNVLQGSGSAALSFTRVSTAAGFAEGFFVPFDGDASSSGASFLIPYEGGKALGTAASLSAQSLCRDFGICP